jgi:hypothetical protein
MDQDFSNYNILVKKMSTYLQNTHKIQHQTPRCEFEVHARIACPAASSKFMLVSPIGTGSPFRGPETGFI